MQCIEVFKNTCAGCYGLFRNCPNIHLGCCSAAGRTDNKNVIFKEVKDMEEIKEIKISIPEGYEIDEKKSTFEKIIFKKKEQEVKNWGDLVLLAKNIPEDSVYITTDSSVKKANARPFTSCDRNIFISKKYAKAALAMAKISQLMPYYGGAVTDAEWNDCSIAKYTLRRHNNKVLKDSVYLSFYLLSFHTVEQRDSFYTNNKQLVEDYLMIPSQPDK